MSITINIHAENADIALHEMRKLLGANAIEVQWKTVDLHQEPAEAPDAPHIEPATAPAEKKTRTRKPKDAPAPSVSSDDTPLTAVQQSIVDGTFGVKSAISTGEERVGPEDDAATIAQDAADEAAETEASRDAAAPLTLDDVRKALGGYAQAYGMDATLADGPTIFKKALGDVPAGTKNAKGEVVTEWCLSATPLDQVSLGKAVQYWTAAVKENPFKRAAA